MPGVIEVASTEGGMKVTVLVLLVGLAASAQAQSCGKTSLIISLA